MAIDNFIRANVENHHPYELHDEIRNIAIVPMNPSHYERAKDVKPFTHKVG